MKSYWSCIAIHKQWWEKEQILKGKLKWLQCVLDCDFGPYGQKVQNHHTAHNLFGATFSLSVSPQTSCTPNPTFLLPTSHFQTDTNWHAFTGSANVICKNDLFHKRACYTVKQLLITKSVPISHPYVLENQTPNLNYNDPAMHSYYKKKETFCI